MRLRVERTRASHIAGAVPWVRPRNLPISLAEGAKHQHADYHCPRGHQFVITLDASAVAPPTWCCRQHGVDSHSIDSAVTPAEHAPSSGQRATTPRANRPLQDVLERRSSTELEALLEHRLAQLRQQRTTQLREAPPSGELGIPTHATRTRRTTRSEQR